MSKQSVEGYEGENWPSTTGNHSGGGRGNAEPEFEDDCWDCDSGPETRIPSVSEAIRRNEIQAEERERARRKGPMVDRQARRYHGRLIDGVYTGRRAIALDTGERHPLHFTVSAEYDDHTLAVQKPYLLDFWLIGDEVHVAVDEKSRIIEYRNVDLTEERIRSENTDRYSRLNTYQTRHQAENEVRSGKLFSSLSAGRPSTEEMARYGYSRGRTPGQGYIERDQRHIYWRLLSGDYEIPGLGFRNLKQAKNCLIELIKSARLCELSESEFRFQSSTFGFGQNAPQIYRCRLVNRHGQPPKNWNHGIPLATPGNGVTVPHRNADRTEYED